MSRSLVVTAPVMAMAAPLNDTDLQYGDMAGIQLPPDTSVAEGLAACGRHCAVLPGCEAWVFVSAAAGDGGPRCALKPSGPCTTVPKLGCYVGFMPGHCGPGPAPPAPSPRPPPPAPPHPPAPSPAEMAPIFHVSPAGCGGGWTNDGCGPFEYNGVHHYFYQATATINK